MDGSRSSRVSPPKSERHDNAEWEKHKQLIKRLYLKENKPLKDVKYVLEKSHNFRATERMYKTKINRWGYGKRRNNLTRKVTLAEVHHARDRRNNMVELRIICSSDDADRLLEATGDEGLEIELPASNSPIALSKESSEDAVDTDSGNNESISSDVKSLLGKAGISLQNWGHWFWHWAHNGKTL